MLVETQILNSLVFGQCVCPNRVHDALTPDILLDSKKFLIYSRSGGTRGFASSPDTKFAIAKFGVK